MVCSEIVPDVSRLISGPVCFASLHGVRVGSAYIGFGPWLQAVNVPSSFTGFGCIFKVIVMFLSDSSSF